MGGYARFRYGVGGYLLFRDYLSCVVILCFAVGIMWPCVMQWRRMASRAWEKFIYDLCQFSASLLYVCYRVFLFRSFSSGTCVAETRNNACP
jgi:hypothetical protein